MKSEFLLCARVHVVQLRLGTGGFGGFGGFSALRSAWFGFWDGFRFGVEDIHQENVRYLCRSDRLR